MVSEKDFRKFEKNIKLSILVVSVAFALLTLCSRTIKSQHVDLILDAIIEEQKNLNAPRNNDIEGKANTTMTLMSSMALAKWKALRASAPPETPTGPAVVPDEIVHVSSQGRCGSKMMMHALHAAGISKQPFLNHLYPHQFRKLVESRKDLLTVRHKIIFLFGDPIRIVQSVESQGEKYGEAWVTKHLRNLRGDDNATAADLHTRDVLNLERLFDMWMSLREPASRKILNYQGEDGRTRRLNTTILTLKYESMWDPECRAMLADHIGVPIKLPEYKRPSDRFSRLPAAEKKKLSATYGILQRKVDESPGCQVIW